jgi:ABC-type glycerol-3-phosphate transport system substrate-binding protein
MKKLLTVLLALVLSIMLVACNGTPAEDVIEDDAPTEEPADDAPTEEPADDTDDEDDMTDEDDMDSEQEPVTITVMSWSQEQSDFYATAKEEFEAEYPWITVEFETLAQDAYREALPLMFQSDDSPDVFFWLGSNRVATMNELLDQGWIGPMSPQDHAEGDWFSRWPDGSFVEGINMVGEDVYSFPFNDNKIWGPGYMYMNNAVFAEAGLDPAEDAPETWSELLDVCRTIREAGPYCMAIPLQGNHLQRTWFPLAGTIKTDSFFDLQEGVYTVNDPAFEEVYNLLLTMYEEDLAIPGLTERDFVRAAVANGEAAIYLGGAWMPSVFANTYDFTDLSVAPPPHPDDGKTGALRQTYSENKWWLSSQSENPEAASIFIEWMTRSDGFFASEYLAQGFGTIAYSDNSKYITDPNMLQVVDIAMNTNHRVLNPEPLVACPDLAQSEAIVNAENIRRNWEWEEMAAALLDLREFGDVAAEIEAEKNEVFLETLAAEAEAGLDVSQECYQFPDWEFNEDFDTSNY